MYIRNFGEFFNNQVEAANTIIISKTDKMSEEKIVEVLASEGLIDKDSYTELKKERKDLEREIETIKMDIEQEVYNATEIEEMKEVLAEKEQELAEKTKEYAKKYNLQNRLTITGFSKTLYLP